MALLSTTPTVAIRAARGSDGPALARLAKLDSKPALTGAVLIAERDGEMAAALSLDSGAHVADPFRPTAELVALLKLHGAELAPVERREIRERRRGAWRLVTHARAA